MSNTPLTDLKTILTASAEPAQALQSALDLVGSHLRVDRCFLYVRNPARGRGRIAFVWRRHEAVPDPRHDWQNDTGELPKEDPLFRAALAARPSVFVDDVHEAGPEVLNQDFERRTFGHRALVHAHITEQGQLWGILQPCVFDHPRHWTPAEHEYLAEAVLLFLPVVQRYMRELGPDLGA
ncbi:GAF domain-containing protein [Hymenobacter cellulosilyticus]|uniref:GAF domain-containing protein n=1 Tax=Hymenobacter cellulosilyticus TaxID=2932248 RepID=A0A8T9QBN2_9BACT|nr:GAF domain-containing protein [Hymenobacter cellulosilyticus]UOQ74907.1 GAF domain-containing protein [Hymenobacter cellulosilyticus]